MAQPYSGSTNSPITLYIRVLAVQNKQINLLAILPSQLVSLEFAQNGTIGKSVFFKHASATLVYKRVCEKIVFRAKCIFLNSSS